MIDFHEEEVQRIVVVLALPLFDPPRTTSCPVVQDPAPKVVGQLWANVIGGDHKKVIAFLISFSKRKNNHIPV